MKAKKPSKELLDAKEALLDAAVDLHNSNSYSHDRSHPGYVHGSSNCCLCRFESAVEAYKKEL